MNGRRAFAIAFLFVMLIMLSFPSVSLVGTPQQGDSVVVSIEQSELGMASSDLLRPADTLIWETIGNPESLDPHHAYDGFGNWISDNVYETLFTHSFDSADTDTLVPLLAESVEISSDEKEYTFNLQQGVKFHDGTPFNASCVKDNIERVLMIFDPVGPAWMLAEPILGGQAIVDAVYDEENGGQGSEAHRTAYEAWLDMNAIEVIDPYKVKIKLESAYQGFLHALSYKVGSMISPTWFETHGPVEVGEFNEYIDTHTCGTGPYMVSEWEYDDHITLVKNPDYWREPIVHQSKPNAGSINTVEIRTVWDDEQRKSNLISGLSDGCFWPPEDADEIFPTEMGVSVWSSDLTYNILGVGFRMAPHYYRSETAKLNPFYIKAFRIACSYAFDYASFISNALFGFGVQAQGFIPIGMFGHDYNLFTYERDMTEAVAAWNDAMNAGLDSYFADNSYRLEFYYVEGDSPTRARRFAMDLLKAAIEDIIASDGAIQPNQPLTIDIISLPLDQFVEYRRTGQKVVQMVGWAADYGDPDNFATGFALPNTAWGWWIGYDNPIVEQLLYDARVELDRDARAELYYQMQQQVVADAAYIWAAQVADFHVERSNIRGYIFNPMRYGGPWPSSWTGGAPYFYYYWKDLSTPFTEVKSSVWWLTEFRKLYQGAETTYDESYIQSLVDAISLSSEAFADIESWQEAGDILNMYLEKGVLGLASRELYALWLNLANVGIFADTGISLGDLTTASTIREAIQECEAVLLDENSSIQDLLRVVRIGQELNAGRY